jgi:hypothetical protein
MSKNVDLWAVGALLFVFVVGSQFHASFHLRATPAQLLRIRTINPIVVRPPHVPAVPHLPHFPRV